jgi:Peptidase A4 family
MAHADSLPQQNEGLVMRRTLATFSTVGMLAAALAVPAAANATAPKKSTNFAGYDVESKKVTSATATFVVPGITCKSKLSGVGPAIILDSSKNVFSGVGVGVTCQSGTPVYESDLIVNNKQHLSFSLAVHDKVTITVKVSKKRTLVRLKDITARKSKTLRGKGRRMTFAEIGAQRVAFGHTNVGVDPFRPMHFSHVLVNGRSLTAEKAFPLERVNKGRIQIAVGKITGRKNFTLTFMHS